MVGALQRKVNKIDFQGCFVHVNAASSGKNRKVARDAHVPMDAYVLDPCTALILLYLRTARP